MENQIHNNSNIGHDRPQRLRAKYRCRFRPVRTGIGFKYTEADETAIENACKQAEQWMTEKYGKGRKPYRFGIGDR